jgi:ABC-type branched-subunit amino acid transport system substrate-binding protein
MAASEACLRRESELVRMAASEACLRRESELVRMAASEASPPSASEITGARSASGGFREELRRREAAGVARWLAETMPKHLLCLAALVAALLFAGCPPPPPARPVRAPSVSAERAAGEALTKARRALARGEREAGLRLLEEVTWRYPDTAAADAARLNLGVAALDAGRDDEARRWLRALRVQPPADPATAAHWHKALGTLEARSGRAEDAQPHLEALVSSGAAGESERRLLAEILLRREDPQPARALEVLEGAGAPAGSRPTPEAQAAARDRLRAILEQRSAEELDTIGAEAPPNQPVGALVRLEQAERLLEGGDPAAAGEVLAPVSAQGLTAEDAERLATLRERVTTLDDIAPHVVGLALPLSGRFAAVGAQARQAVELAREQVAPGLQLVVRDTGGTPEGAAAAIEALAREDRAVAVLGPVGYQESAEAAAAAERLGLPLLPLSSREDLGEGRAFVLRTFLTREAEGQALARWAVTRRGLTRLAALYPENAYGGELVKAFAEEAARLGAPLAATVGYEPGTTDFARPLAELLGRRVPPKDDLTAKELGFDALFLPDTAQPVRRIVSWLKYARVPLATRPGRPGVQLLGASGWNDPAVIDPAEALTDNAVFTAAFVPDAEDPTVSEFLRSFLDRHGARPTSFQAECYDAAGLLFETVAGPRAGDRVALREALGQVRNRVGVTGVWTVLPDGRVRRSIPVLTVDGEVLRPRLSEEEEAELRRDTPLR